MSTVQTNIIHEDKEADFQYPTLKELETDIRIQADEILFLKERLNTELSERTGKDYETIKEDTDRDFYMSPNEAVEYGLIDLVLDKKPIKV